MTAKSLNSSKEKQMEDYKYTKLHCVHLGDGLGSRALAEPRKSHFSPTDRNMTEVSIKAACWGEGRAPIFLCSHLYSFSHTTLHFNGLCRKSMWDRLHRGRKRVWSSTNKHYGQTAAALKVEISANPLTLTLFWAEGTLLRGVIQKNHRHVAFVDFLCLFVELYLLRGDSSFSVFHCPTLLLTNFDMVACEINI